MIFEQEVSIFNPNAIHSKFIKYDTAIEQNSRHIKLIATKEELLQSAVSGKSFLETSEAYVDVRADSITQMVRARYLGGKNLLYNTSNPTSPADLPSGATQEEITQATEDGYKYLVAGSNSYSSIRRSTYWEQNVFCRDVTTNSGERVIGNIYSSRARLNNIDRLYTFSCDYCANNYVGYFEISLCWDKEDDPKTGTGKTNETLLYSSDPDIGTTPSQESIQAYYDSLINYTPDEYGIFPAKVEEYVTTNSEKWVHIELPFYLETPADIYPYSGYILFKMYGKQVNSQTARLMVTHLQLEKGGIASSHEETSEEILEESYSMIQQTKDRISMEVANKTSRASIIMSINGDSSSTAIKADNITLTGTDSISIGLGNKLNSSDFTGLRIVELINGETSAKIQADHISMSANKTLTMTVGDMQDSIDDMGDDISGLSYDLNSLVDDVDDLGDEVDGKLDSNDFTGQNIITRVNATGNTYHINAGKIVFSNLTDARDANGNIVDIGSWKINYWDKGELYYGGANSHVGDSGTILLNPKNNLSSSVVIAGSSSKNDWRITVADKFGVDSGGNLYANGANITGNITCNSLTLNSGVTISSSKVTGLSSVATSGSYNDLSSTPNLTVYIAKDGTIGTLPASGATSSNTTGFQVSTAGLLQASNAVIYGTVYASSGLIGGWEINNGNLKSGTAGSTSGIYLSPSGNVSATISDKTWSDWMLTIGSKFGVDHYGNMVSSNAYIAGDITANSLTITSTNLNNTFNSAGILENSETSFASTSQWIKGYRFNKIATVQILDAPSSFVSIPLSQHLNSTFLPKYKIVGTCCINKNSTWYSGAITIETNGSITIHRYYGDGGVEGNVTSFTGLRANISYAVN